MIRPLLCILLMSVQLACGEIPRLFREKQFTVVTFAEAVNYFVALGEQEAVRQLENLEAGDDGKGPVRINERAGWMCRVLFESKNGEPLRPPGFGGLGLPDHTMPEKSWPLYPVALSGSTYFVLSEGYSLAGKAESVKKYIQYCRQTGSFRRQPVSVPDKAQALKDVAALKTSAPWKAIKWKDSGHNWSYTISEAWIWKYISSQAEGVM